MTYDTPYRPTIRDHIEMESENDVSPAQVALNPSAPAAVEVASPPGPRPDPWPRGERTQAGETTAGAELNAEICTLELHRLHALNQRGLHGWPYEA